MSGEIRNQIILNKGCYSAIARTIPSKKSKSGHISVTYVSQVSRGIITRDNATTREIFRKAKEIQSVLNS